MPSNFRRRFTCRKCESDAKVEILARGVVAVACDRCDVSELWIEPEQIGPLENLTYVQPEARA